MTEITATAVSVNDTITTCSFVSSYTLRAVRPIMERALVIRVLAKTSVPSAR